MLHLIALIATLKILKSSISNKKNKNPTSNTGAKIIEINNNIIQSVGALVFYLLKYPSIYIYKLLVHYLVTYTS